MREDSTQSPQLRILDTLNNVCSLSAPAKSALTALRHLTYTPSSGYQESKALVGKTANIYKTELQGELAFLVSFDNSVGKFCANLEQNQMTKRLDALESEVNGLKSLIFQVGSEADADKENQRPRARFEPASWPPQGHRITKLPHLGTASNGE